MKNNITTNDKNIYDVIIIGAGASGLFAAASAGFHAKGASSPAAGFSDAAKGNATSLGSLSFSGLILEKTARAGTKLLMSGSGQCNITHAGSIKDFVPCYGDRGKKIRSCLYKHSNLELMEFLEENGVEVFTREDGKVFPRSMDAHDVLYMLLRRAKKNGFEIAYDSAATGIHRYSEKPAAADRNASVFSDISEPLWQINAGDTTYTSRNVIIAAGGCSYPATGSDGFMFHVLKNDLGINITPLKPALSSIKAADYPYSELSGISFDKVNTSIWRNDKKIAETSEGFLFTHKDISGPAVINISKYAEPGDKIKVNYLYPLNYEQVIEKLKTLSHGSKVSPANMISTAFDLPKRFCQLIAERSGTSLKELAKRLTGEEFMIDHVAGFNKAMATSGGIDLKQIDTATFGFKEHPGLYAIGEALDVDGITGGYNLQFAYSSARTAIAAVHIKMTTVLRETTTNNNGDQ